MRSIRFLLFYLFPLVLVACVIASDVRQTLVFTSDWRDLTIVGRGYFNTLDEEGNSQWYRSIRLGLNGESSLCANINGVLRPLEHRISIPHDWTRIEISGTGEIFVTSHNEAGTMVGIIAVELFTDGDNSDANQFADPESVRMVTTPGNAGAGYLMQQAMYKNCLPLTGRVGIACVFAIIWVAMVIWASSRKSNPEVISGKQKNVGQKDVERGDG